MRSGAVLRDRLNLFAHLLRQSTLSTKLSFRQYLNELLKYPDIAWVFEELRMSTVVFQSYSAGFAEEETVDAPAPHPYWAIAVIGFSLVSWLLIIGATKLFATFA